MRRPAKPRNLRGFVFVGQPLIDQFDALHAASVANLRIGGFIIGSDAFFAGPVQKRARLATHHRIPAIYWNRDRVPSTCSSWTARPSPRAARSARRPCRASCARPGTACASASTSPDWLKLKNAEALADAHQTQQLWVVSGYVSIDDGRMVCMRSLGPHTTIGEMGLMTGLNGARADRLRGWAYRIRTGESVRAAPGPRRKCTSEISRGAGFGLVRGEPTLGAKISPARPLA